MTDTIREKIAQSVESGLADILIADGYNTDMGKLIKRGIRLVDQDQLPGLAFFLLVEDNLPIPGKNTLSMIVRIEALAKFGSKNPSVQAELMLGDIITRMTGTALDSICGGYEDSVQYIEGGVSDYPEAGQYTIGVYANFRVNYKTKIGF